MSIPLAFFILSALLLWLIIGVKGRWGVKAFVISLVLYSCLSIDFSLENLMGWPSDQSLPKEFHVHWVKIKEPNKKTSEKGYIYVWVTDLNRSISKQGWQGWKGYFISFQSYDPTEPRAYRLDYSKDRHEQAQKALDMIQSGEKVGGKNNGKGGGGKGKGKGGKGEGKGKGKGSNGGGSLSRSDDIIFHDLPPSKLPEKVTR